MGLPHRFFFYLKKCINVLKNPQINFELTSHYLDLIFNDASPIVSKPDFVLVFKSHLFETYLLFNDWYSNASLNAFECSNSQNERYDNYVVLSQKLSN